MTAELKNAGVTSGGVGRDVAGWMFAVILGLFLVLYSCLRAYKLSFVHDEAASYLMYVILGPKTLFDCYAVNNHFLNSFLVFLSGKFFGTSEFALRLPNIMFHVVFIIAAYLLVRGRFGVFLSACALLLLNMNPFVLEFFALARGYGIAVGLMLLGIYFFLRAYEKPEPDRRSILYAFWCAGLSALANMSFVNFLVSMLVIYIVNDTITVLRTRSGWMNLADRSVVAEVIMRTRFFYKHIVLMAIVLVPVLYNFKKEACFYYGGMSGFWVDTVGSLLRCTAYGCSYGRWFVFAGQFAVLAVLAISAGALVYRMLWKGGRTTFAFRMVLSMLVLNVMLVLVQSRLFRTPYPIDRTAIHLIILFMLTCVMLLDFLLSVRSEGFENTVACVFAGGAVLMAVHTVHCANLTSTLIWRYDCQTKQMLYDIDNDLRGRQGKIRLGVNWEFEPSVNYYYSRRRLPWLQIVTRDGIGGRYDYYYVMPEFRDELKKRNVSIIKEYPATGNLLARKLPEKGSKR